MAEDSEDLNDQLLIGEYQNEFDRKGKLQNKTLGYFVIELCELMISLTVTSLVFALGVLRLSKVAIFAVVALFSIFYFFIWSLLIAGRYYRNHTLLVADISRLLDEASAGNIRSALAYDTAKNREINNLAASCEVCSSARYGLYAGFIPRTPISHAAYTLAPKSAAELRGMNPACESMIESVGRTRCYTRYS